jgi:hypothetical protein
MYSTSSKYLYYYIIILLPIEGCSRSARTYQCPWPLRQRLMAFAMTTAMTTLGIDCGTIIRGPPCHRKQSPHICTHTRPLRASGMSSCQHRRSGCRHTRPRPSSNLRLSYQLDLPRYLSPASRSANGVPTYARVLVHSVPASSRASHARARVARTLVHVRPAICACHTSRAGA